MHTLKTTEKQTKPEWEYIVAKHLQASRETS